MSYRFNLNETSFHGYGAIQNIVPEVKGRDFKKAFVCTDPDLVKFKVVNKVLDLLTEAGLEYTLYDNIKPNPTIENVQTGVKALKDSGADYIIAVGGGSSMDTAKAIGIIATNPEFADVRSLEGASPTKKACLPIIAVPTTAGTAAEVTINYVITDEERHRKFVCVDPHDMPIIAVVDPDMMGTMPKGLTAATGMDALTHAIEAYTASLRSNFSDPLALKAIEMVNENLVNSFNGDEEARSLMHEAQCLAGMAFSNALLGIVHSMAHKVGAVFHIPHGCANAIFLPYVIQYNRKECENRYADIARVLKLEGKSDSELTNSLINKIREFNVALNIPATMKEYGITEVDFLANVKHIAHNAVLDACTGSNPRTIDDETMEKLLSCTFYGSEVKL